MTDQTPSNVIALHPAAEDWPAPPRPTAFTGLAGEIARAIEPHGESDPLAILAQLLVCFGSVIGRGARYAVEATGITATSSSCRGTERQGRKGAASRIACNGSSPRSTQTGSSSGSCRVSLQWRGLSSGRCATPTPPPAAAPATHERRRTSGQATVGARGRIRLGLQDGRPDGNTPVAPSSLRLGWKAATGVDQEQSRPARRAPTSRSLDTSPPMNSSGS